MLVILLILLVFINIGIIINISRLLQLFTIFVLLIICVSSNICILLVIQSFHTQQCMNNYTVFPILVCLDLCLFGTLKERSN